MGVLSLRVALVLLVLASVDVLLPIWARLVGARYYRVGECCYVAPISGVPEVVCVYTGESFTLWIRCGSFVSPVTLGERGWLGTLSGGGGVSQRTISKGRA